MSTPTYYIANDLGKHSTKALSNKNQFVTFKSKYDESNYAIRTAQTHHLMHEGHTYLVGEEGILSDYSNDKATFSHKLCLMTALGLLVEEPDATCYLGVGCPAQYFKDKRYKETFKRFFLENQHLSFVLNDQPKHIFLKDLLICPESIGGVLAIPPSATSLIGVIDIGGLNTNGCIYNGVVPIRESIFTIDGGTHILLNQLKNEINMNNVKQNMQDYELPYAIHNPRYKVETDHTMKHHVYKIYKEMQKNSWNLEGLDLVFIGGGSLLLEKFIKEQFQYAHISQKAVRNNVDAYLQLLIAYFK